MVSNTTFLIGLLWNYKTYIKRMYLDKDVFIIGIVLKFFFRTYQEKDNNFLLNLLIQKEELIKKEVIFV